MKRILHVDIETYSAVDLAKAGYYRYVDDPSFEVLLFACAYGDHAPTVIDLTRYPIPAAVLQDLLNPDAVKVAHNAAFERVCLAQHLRDMPDRSYYYPLALPADQWRCTMVHATELGMPASLKQLAIWLDTDYQKDAAGTRLINKFSKPDKNGKRLLPADDPDGWEQFKAYCLQDVKTEQAIYKRLQATPLPKSEWCLWQLDQEINDRGFKVDLELVKAAQAMDKTIRAAKMAELKELTGLGNPASVQQLSGWVASHDVDLPNLLKATVQQAIESGQLPDIVRQALELRIELSNASTKKYDAFLAMADSDNTVRGTLQFYGAGRTGRWAGRGVQIQNMPRSTVKPARLAKLREAVKTGDATAGGDELKQLIRTAIIPREGYKFLVSDFSAIEARILAWLSGEAWVLESFERGDDLYEAMAAKMLHVPLAEVTKEQRAKGKIAVLACGYQGGVGALKRMGGEAMGLTDYEMERIVQQWRKANSNLVKLWERVEKAAKHAIRNPDTMAKLAVGLDQFLRFQVKDGVLFIMLASGRALTYQRPSLTGGGIRFFSRGIPGSMSQEETYGGKLVENIVQATARDILAEALINLDLLGYRVVAHVHDEVIIESPDGSRSAEGLDPILPDSVRHPALFTAGRVEDVNEILAIGASWTKGLPLAAEGFESEFYKKGE